MARNSEHLAAYEKEFKDKGIEVDTKVAVASKPYSVTKAFDELKVQFDVPDVLFYNVGITGLDAEFKEACADIGFPGNGKWFFCWGLRTYCTAFRRRERKGNA